MEKDPWEVFNKSKNKKDPEIKAGSFLSYFPFFNNFNLKYFSKFNLYFYFLPLIFIFLFSSFFIVKPNENAVILRFGKFVRVVEEGLHFKLPYPFEKAILKSTTSSRVLKVPYKNEKVISMLTSDENLINLEFEVHWRINNLANFLFKVVDPEYSIYKVSESIMREVVGNFKLKNILTDSRHEVEMINKEKLQSLCDDYELGVEIILVQVLKAEPPYETINAFRDVQAAKIEKESIINKSYATKSVLINKAESDAKAVIFQAESQAVERLNSSKANSIIFEKLYTEYLKYPASTRKQIYLDSLEKIFNELENITIIDSNVKGVYFQNSNNKEESFKNKILKEGENIQ